MVGGGAQVQAFFGYEKGYFAILYLDTQDALRDTEKQRENLAKKNHTLQPQFEHHEPLFKDLLLPGVKVRFYGRAPSPMD